MCVACLSLANNRHYCKSKVFHKPHFATAALIFISLAIHLDNDRHCLITDMELVHHAVQLFTYLGCIQKVQVICFCLHDNRNSM